MCLVASFLYVFALVLCVSFVSALFLCALFLCALSLCVFARFLRVFAVLLCVCFASVWVLVSGWCSFHGVWVLVSGGFRLFISGCPGTAFPSNRPKFRSVCFSQGSSHEIMARKKKAKRKPLTELYVKGNFTEDREECQKELQRHCEGVYTDQEETKEVQEKQS